MLFKDTPQRAQTLLPIGLSRRQKLLMGTASISKEKIPRSIPVYNEETFEQKMDRTLSSIGRPLLDEDR